MTQMANCVALTLIALALPGRVWGEEFEVASVRLIQEKEFTPRPFGKMMGGPGTERPNRIAYARVWVQKLLCDAWELRPFQVIGPAWMSSVLDSSYELEAITPPGTTRQQVLLMLQYLLIHRFHLKYHFETRNVSGYDLIVATGGPKLQESIHAGDPEPATGPTGEKDKDGFPVLPPGHGGMAALSLRDGGMRAKFQLVSLDEFANHLRGYLTTALGRTSGPINNRTGLTGKYDFTFAFRVGSSAVVSGVNGASAQAEPVGGSGLPDIFRALERQLGLKLVSVKRIPLKFLVVDSIDRAPTEN
jgi:uncharacterized protein (TIGR03435 family)